MDIFDKTIIASAMTDFSEISDQARNHASVLLNMISAGHVPTKVQMQEFDADIAELQKHYDIILDSAKQILLEDEMPSDLSAGELVAAVESKQKKELEKKVLAACLLLQRFTSVKSYLETYAQALEPYQKKADALLEEIDNGNLEAISESTVIDSSRAFLNAMEFDNYESAEGLSALEALEQYFPIRIQLGIARRQYYLKESRPTEAVAAEVSDTAPEKPLAEVSDTASEKPLAEAHDSLPEKAEEQIKSENKTEEPDEPDVEEEVCLTSINKVKKAAPSASSFKKELPKLPEEACDLLPLFTNLGALSEKQAFKFGVAMECFVDDEIAFSTVRKCLSTLCNKSLLSSCDVDGELVYCLTTYCYGCLKKETIQQSRMFKISFGRNAVVSDSSIEKSRLKRAVDYNEILLRYFYGIKDAVSKDDYQAIKGSLVMRDGFYNIAVQFDGEKYICTLYDNAADPVESEYLLIVDDHIPDGITEKYQAVFLYKDGAVYRFPETENDIEQELNELPTYQKEADSSDQKETPGKESKTDVSIKPEIKTTVQNTKSSEYADTTVSNIREGSKELLSITEMINTAAVPDDTTFYNYTAAIASGRIMSGGVISDAVRAAMFAYSVSFNKACSKCARLSQKLLLATHLPFGNYHYTSGIVSDALSDCENEFIKLAVYIQSLLTPASSYDYVLYSMAEGAFKDFDSEFPNARYAKPLYNKLLLVH